MGDGNDAIAIWRIVQANMLKCTSEINTGVNFEHKHELNPFTPENTDKLKGKQHQSKVLLNSFPMNGCTLGFCPQDRNL